MIVLFTDFGSAGPYVGQMHAVLAMSAPGTPVVDLFHDLPHFDSRAAAYLLPAYASIFPPQTVFICVVDPGVGGERRALALQADDKWYVGPDNGIFNLVMRRAQRCVAHEIRWCPPGSSVSFHGRDLFAPVAARLLQGLPSDFHPVTLAAPVNEEWPDDLSRVLYIDGYGNAISGVRSSQIPADSVLRVKGRPVPHARVFGDVPPGQAFWYGNANGLVEIAVNRGSARQRLDLALGDEFEW